MLTTLFYSLFALDQSLVSLAGQYGHWLYAILFFVIFAETGLVVFPFLPGDSILFISGTIVATAGLDVHLLTVILIAAAIPGDFDVREGTPRGEIALCHQLQIPRHSIPRDDTEIRCVRPAWRAARPCRRRSTASAP